MSQLGDKTQLPAGLQTVYSYVAISNTLPCAALQVSDTESDGTWLSAPATQYSDIGTAVLTK